MKMEFVEISNLEAMVKIDSNDIDDLYFSYKFYHSEHGLGNLGRTVRHPTPRDWGCSDPIKYGIEKKHGLFNHKIGFSKPETQKDTMNTIHLGHIWLKKIVHAEEYTSMKPPIKLPRKEEKVNNEKI